MKIRVNANTVVTNKEGKFLLVKLKGGPFAGRLCIPGGGIDPGELSHDAARREVEEETGIKINEEIIPFGFCEMMHHGIDRHRIVLLLHTFTEGKPKETDEGFAEWLTYEEAEKDLIPFAKEAIKIWKNKGLHFTLIGKEIGIE